MKQQQLSLTSFSALSARTEFISSHFTPCVLSLLHHCSTKIENVETSRRSSAFTAGCLSPQSAASLICKHPICCYSQTLKNQSASGLKAMENQQASSLIWFGICLSLSTQCVSVCVLQLSHHNLRCFDSWRNP